MELAAFALLSIFMQARKTVRIKTAGEMEEIMTIVIWAWSLLLVMLGTFKARSREQLTKLVLIYFTIKMFPCISSSKAI